MGVKSAIATAVLVCDDTSMSVVRYSRPKMPANDTKHEQRQRGSRRRLAALYYADDERLVAVCGCTEKHAMCRTVNHDQGHSTYTYRRKTVEEPQQQRNDLHATYYTVY